MKISLLLMTTLFTLSMACNTGGRNGFSRELKEQFSANPQDREILEELFSRFAEFKDSATSDLLVTVGRFFMGSPYTPHTLEQEPETLVVNLREFDCNTYVESCLAISRTIRSGNHSIEQFTSELRSIRYRNGIIEGFTSRIHYFSDWIYENHYKQVIRDASKEIGGKPFHKQVNFMSTHPGSYRQLLSDSSLVEIIAGQETEISGREMYYVPKDQLPDLESGLCEGDIVGITTGIGGLDISHVGILAGKPGGFHLLHASSKSGKVILSEETLGEYLANSPSATGIMVARPL
jgi:hypothetical protein